MPRFGGQTGQRRGEIRDWVHLAALLAARAFPQALPIPAWRHENVGAQGRLA